MALTSKKKKFADALLAGNTQKNAAVIAGYSETSASQAGSRLCKDQDVEAYIKRVRAAKSSISTPKQVSQKVNIHEPKVNKKVNKTDGNVKSDLTSVNAENIGAFSDPKDYLLHVMNDELEEPRLRIDAAKSLMPYVHGKVADQGKKEAKQERARHAAKKFAPSAPPKLVVNNGGAR